MSAADGTGTDLADEAIALAERWIAEAASEPAEPSARLLAGMLGDPRGLPFAVGFVDGVLRPESNGAAASRLHRVAELTPDFLPWRLRAAVRVGGAVAPALPTPVVPLARRAVRDLVDHLVVDARPGRLGPVLERLRAEGNALNLNLLGEAVLGEVEAGRRLDGIRRLVDRDDVDHVSVKVSAIASRLAPWGFDETVDDVVARLLPLYRAAAANGTFLNLDMEEYRDLDLTIAVFTRLLESAGLEGMEAGIVLQAYLPDALPAARELAAWARQRVAAGGARIAVRLVKGANLPMERVEATLHGWTPAPYDAKVDTDANYLRILDGMLTPANAAAVRVGVAGHNLFDVAHAWLLAGRRGVRDAVRFEMLLGMATGQVRAVSRDVGPVLLYVPVVHPDEFDVAIGYLVRRLEENAAEENFLSAAFSLADDPALLERERERYLASAARSEDPALRATPRRTQDRGPAAAEGRVLRDPADAPPDDGLTQVVLGIARSAQETETARPSVRFGGVDFVETAVYATRETDAAEGAPGFRNAPDSDPALAENRAWARDVVDAIATSTAGDATIAAARVDDEDAVDALVARTVAAGAAWGARPAAERAQVLRAAARMLELRRGALIEVAAAETGKVFAEADAEVSEAVDFANYYAATAPELDRVPGAVFVPARATVVAPPWNFPLSIPAGGTLAALAAGSGVVLKPAPQARRCAAVLAEALWDAGVPREALALVDLDEDALGRTLIEHPDVDRVLLTGSWETAALFRRWRPDLRLHAETSGKNALIVMPSADLDLAVADLVRSAFSHAGQKCSAASLAILVGPVARSARFARQLVDAVTSLRVAAPTDPRADVPPLVEAPHGKLAWALSTLGEGERWLVEPRMLDGGPELAGRLWSPGVRIGVQPGSRFHREEFFGPVLGIMSASSLAAAIDLQNGVEYGLTAGLHTQEPADLAQWLERVEAGNLSVNRGITGAIVQRQPFGGWKRSSVGPGAKAGGPNHLVGLGGWRASTGAASSTLHLRGLDSRITTLIEAAQPSLDYPSFEWLRRGALSDAVAWDREFGRVRDASRLGIERNLLRYRPVAVAVRATSDAPLQEVLRVVLAGVRAASAITLSAGTGLPAAVRRVLDELGVPVYVETDAQWCERMSGAKRDILAAAADEDPVPRAPRVRLVGSPASVDALRTQFATVTAGDPDLAVFDGEVTTAGRLELLPFLREQSISITAHRFGTPDPWSESVI
jgi:RHH-type transcriptional regulator, proline utilization regulon repressor / proline dehydrogenase / delta 1-pyrroline-5-carboxylate dehydrogenase